MLKSVMIHLTSHCDLTTLCGVYFSESEEFMWLIR